MNAAKRLGVILLLGSFFALLTERVMAPPAGAGIHSVTALMAPALVGCNPNCPGDVNGDNMVNGADLSVLLASFGNNCNVDADGDGWTVAQGDCNDSNPNINPGAAEICDNGIDDNCNGQVDFADPSCNDPDGDGIPDNVDNCPTVFNPTQADGDADGAGDACDNCPFVSNPGQQDSNSNGIGDACEGSYCQMASQCPPRPNASPICLGNQCGYVCNVGYADCDGDPLNGCEVFVLGDPNNCSACNLVCPPNHVCVNGQCVLQCPVGFTNCGGQCKDLLNDASNCGGCGNMCMFPTSIGACINGQCQIAACISGFANCDNITANGCETDILNSPTNCGGCNIVCNLPNATSTCIAGQCMISSCAPGFANCNGLQADGCEVNITNSVNNCGACGNVCTPTANVTSVTCLNGNCKITGCLPNWLDQNGIYADGCEVFNNPN